MSRAGYLYTADEFYCDVPDCQNRASAHSHCPRGWLAVYGDTEAAGYPPDVRKPRSSSSLHLCTMCKKRPRHELRRAGFHLCGGRYSWEVHRASTTYAPTKLIFRGAEGEARKKFEKAASYMRRGAVILVRPDGEIVAEK